MLDYVIDALLYIENSSSCEGTENSYSFQDEVDFTFCC